MPLLLAGWHPYTSGVVKRSVGAFLSDCGGSGFYLQIETIGRTRIQGRLGQFTQPLRSAFTSQAADFRSILTRQNAQDEGQCRGSILQQDKGRGSQAPPPKSQRPATRVVSRALTFRAAGIKGGRWTSLRTSQVVIPYLKPAQHNGFADAPAGCTSGVKGRL